MRMLSDQELISGKRYTKEEIQSLSDNRLKALLKKLRDFTFHQEDKHAYKMIKGMFIDVKEEILKRKSDPIA